MAVEQMAFVVESDRFRRARGTDPVTAKPGFDVGGDDQVARVIAPRAWA